MSVEQKTWQYITVYRRTSQYIAEYCSISQDIAEYRSISHYIAFSCGHRFKFIWSCLEISFCLQIIWPLISLLKFLKFMVLWLEPPILTRFSILVDCVILIQSIWMVFYSAASWIEHKKSVSSFLAYIKKKYFVNQGYF